MKRILGFVLASMVFSVALLAAPKSQTFYLADDVRVGTTQLGHGICEVSWTEASGSQVQVTLKSEDKKTVTVPAQMVVDKQGRPGVVTSVVNGVTYLNELHTKNAKFILQNDAK